MWWCLHTIRMENRTRDVVVSTYYQNGEQDYRDVVVSTYYQNGEQD